jgi:type VI secretion system protein VasJ
VSGSGTAPSAASAANDGEPGAFEEGLAEARKLALTGKLDECIRKLTTMIESDAVSGRDRFRAKLTMADACSTAGSPALAEGILAGLSTEVQQFRLEEWEPKMAEACYRSRYEALVAMAGESAKSRDELVDVYRRLCAVAPAAALKLGKPPG